MTAHKLWATLAAIVAIGAATLAIGAAPAMASTTDSCIELGPGPIGAQSCFATTSETHVDYGIVRMGRYSAGSYTLTCSQHGETFTKQGNIPRGGTRSFFAPQGLFGFNDPTCTLSARAHNVVVNRRASASVTLIS
jgi:hypothetical protein